MKLKQLIENRYSVRAYLPRPVEKEKLDYILECMRLAPSACNNQPWVFYVVTDKDVKSRIRQAYDKEWIEEAPVNIIVCKNNDEVWVRRYDGHNSGDIDATIAAQHLCLAVAEQGLGTCWVCAFDPLKLKEVLGLPNRLEPVAVFPIGYEDKERSKVPQKKRKTIGEVTKWI